MPLTAEEKKQRKAEKKAQKLREAEEKKIKARKDELSREVAASKENVAKNMTRWYFDNYAARFPHIKQDMEIAWHMFEHTLDVKDFIIFELTNRMEEAKIQEAMSWQDFSIKVDDLISEFYKRIDILDKDYQDSQHHLIIKALRAKRDDELTQSELEDYYKTVLFIMEQTFNDISSATQGEFVTRLDEEAKKGQHATEVASAALEKNLQTTVAAIKDTLDEYKESTEAQRKEVDTLRLKDEHFIDMIKKQDSRMAKLCDELSNLQGEVSVRYESRVVLEDLKKDREETFSEYTEVRSQLIRDAAHDNKQLLTLTTESNKVINDLEHILEKGEKIIRLAALCRKLETQEEKVLPFGFPIDLPEEFPAEGDVNSPFALFWRRYANANLLKEKLESTLQDLYTENQELKQSLEASFKIMSMTRV